MVASPAIVPMSSLEMDPLKKDFRNFLWKTWMNFFGEEPTRNMYEIAYRLQHGPDRDEIMGFRGVAKSYVTVTYGVSALYCDPTEIVLTVSGSDGGAKGNAILAFSMISTFDWLEHMRPTGILRQSSQAFDVQGSNMEKCESFAALSLFGPITGRRASLIIPDDVETPNTSETEGDRARLETRYAELGGAILKPGGKIKVLGTAQTENTLYLKNLAKGYGLWMLPARFPTPSTEPKKDELAKYGDYLAPHIRKALEANPELAGTCTEPTRFTEADLQGRKLEYGVTEFERQFMLFLDAGAADDKPLKLRDLIVLDIIPPDPLTPGKYDWLVPGSISWSPLPAHKIEGIEVDALNGDSSLYAPSAVDHFKPPEHKVLVVDPSGGGSDETSWDVLGSLYGRIFLAHADARLEGFSDDTLKAIAEDACLWRVNKIIIEKNYGGGMYGQLLRPHLKEVAARYKKAYPGWAWDGCDIEEPNAGSVQKEVRILDVMQGIVTGHRLVVSERVLRADFRVSYSSVSDAKKRFYRLTYQLTRLSRAKGCLGHDDRIDSLASGCADFMALLHLATKEAEAKALEDYFAEQARRIDEALAAQRKPLLGSQSQVGKLGIFLGETPHSLSQSPLFPGRRT